MVKKQIYLSSCTIFVLWTKICC